MICHWEGLNYLLFYNRKLEGPPLALTSRSGGTVSSGTTEQHWGIDTVLPMSDVFVI